MSGFYYTEGAIFAQAGQKDCYNDLGVEKYIIVETLDSKTCPICGDMDGKIFPMSAWEIGVTAPIFHPRCRGTTAPYFDDMEGTGERFARDNEGKSYGVPKGMTYKEWQNKYFPPQNNNKALTESKKNDILVMSRYINSNDILYKNAQKIKPIHGYVDQVIHGDATGFELRDHDGKTIATYTPREFAEILREDPNYHGEDIRLISCGTGAEGAIAAQALAYQLKVNVLAPTDDVLIYSDGSMKIGEAGNGKWVLFKGR